MAHGRVSVVLGVQSGLTAITHLCENAKRAAGAQPVPPNVMSFGGAVRNRLTDAEILSVLTQLAHMDGLLKREQVSVHWSIYGANARAELPPLAQALGISFGEGDLLAPEDCERQDFDAIIYVPLDVQQPRQVEHLAKLSMTAPRVRHVAFASLPRWNHSQLMALRETWEWVDPKQNQRILMFGEDVVRANGGITRKDLAKINLPKTAVKEDTRQSPNILTRSPAMKEILDLIDAVADTDSTILITGESGTGKELVAQRIHAKSHRHNMPFVVVNCAAIPEELLESELFGHIKGAFTGAVANREGRFSAAEGGTLFLDEIGEMGANLQVKLLRVLQSRTFEPVGATKSRVANVRIVAATNRDLEKEVAEGRFREDLFYRLNVIPVHLIPLRERHEDIQMLVDHFVRKFNHEKSRRVTGVTRASLRALVAYEWPGNIREVENLMERMVILKCSGMIDALDFPEKYRRVSLSEIEYDDLMNASRSLSGQQAAQVLLGAQSMSMDDESGEEGMMKINGTFTKGRIEQSSQQAQGNGAQAGMGSMDGSNESMMGAGAESIGADFEGSITVEQAIRLISDKMAFPVEGLDFNSVVDQFENILILQALERTGWNRNRAAGLLRLNRTTLVEKLKKKQLMPPLRFADQSVLEGNA